MNILSGAAQIVQVIGALAGIFSAVAVMVQAVEGPGGGPEKKKAVLDGIAGIYDAAQDWLEPVISKERVIQVASTFIDVLVALYNAIGLFQRKQAAIPNS